MDFVHIYLYFSTSQLEEQDGNESCWHWGPESSSHDPKYMYWVNIAD
jgi:hypothetical protein